MVRILFFIAFLVSLFEVIEPAQGQQSWSAMAAAVT